MDQITVIILEWRRKDANETNRSIMELMEKHENLLGKLDAVFAQLGVINPSEEEIQ